jgi:hypothetical protein
LKIQTPQLRIGRGIKKVSLSRFVVSKFAYQPNKIEGRDVLCLYTNQLWLESQCQRDVKFEQKFGEDVRRLSKLLSTTDLSTRTGAIAFGNKVQTLIPSFMVPERNYSQWKSRFAGVYEYVKPKPLGVPNSQIPPEPYIGIGYRDKGTAKDPAVDGSPSWQEVANAASVKEQNMRIKELEEFKRVLENSPSLDEIAAIAKRLVALGLGTSGDEKTPQADRENPTTDERE